MGSNVELCGFITSDDDIWWIDNVHLEPRHNYFFDPQEVETAVHEIYEIRQEKIVGQFHTHPNNVPWPSPRDIAGWPNPDLNWRYWIVTNAEVIEWELVRDNA